MRKEMKRSQAEVWNLYGFIMYIIGMLWGIMAFLGAIVFTVSKDLQEIRIFFSVQAGEVNTYIFYLGLLGITLSIIALAGKKILRRTELIMNQAST